MHRGPANTAETAQLPLHSSVLPHLCLQVQQRAQECIKALNLILKISSGEEVMNVLNSDFDWNHLKVSEGSWLPSVEPLGTGTHSLPCWLKQTEWRVGDCSVCGTVSA